MEKLRFKDENGNDYPELKNSTLGDISQNVNYGSNSEAINYDGANRYLRITDIENHNKLNNDYKSLEKLENKYILKENDIVFARTASVGVNYLYNEDAGKLFFAGYLIRFNIKKENDSKYIKYLCETKYYWDWVRKNAKGSVTKGLNAEQYKKFKINLPNLEEQNKIANYFENLDIAINETQKEINEFEKYKKDMLHKIFKQNKFNNITKYEHLDKLIITHKKSNFFANEGKTFGKFKFFTSSKEQNMFLDKYLYEDAIIANTGGVFDIKYCEEKFSTSTDCFVFSAKEGYSTQYLNYFLSSLKKEINDLMFYGTGLKHLNKTEFKNINVPIIDYEHQIKISNFLSSIDNKITNTKMELDNLNNLKKDMLEKMF